MVYMFCYLRYYTSLVHVVPTILVSGWILSKLCPYDWNLKSCVHNILLSVHYEFLENWVFEESLFIYLVIFLKGKL